MADLNDLFPTPKKPAHKLDLPALNDALLALASQAFLEGANSVRAKNYEVDNAKMNERREEILSLIKAEVAVAVMVGKD